MEIVLLQQEPESIKYNWFIFTNLLSSVADPQSFNKDP